MSSVSRDQKKMERNWVSTELTKYPPCGHQAAVRNDSVKGQIEEGNRKVRRRAEGGGLETRKT